MAYTKPSGVNSLWAASGDKTSVPPAKVSAGWVAEKPSFQYFNQILYNLGLYDAYSNERGIPEWDDETEYQNGKSFVVGSDGNLYKCLITGDNVDPIGDDGTNWLQVWNNQGVLKWNLSTAYAAGSVIKYTNDINYICHTPQAAGTAGIDHSAFIAVDFYGSYAYAVSQLANGDDSLVGFIYEGQTVDSFDYLIYPSDGRIYARGSVTGTTSAAFNPAAGTATGLSGALTNVNINNISSSVATLESQLNKSVTITMTDATYSLSSAEKLYGRIVIGGTLTAQQELVVGSSERFLTVKNNTAFAVKAVCVASGSGIHIPSGATFDLRVNDASEVETNGNANEIIINELKGNGTTITYPFGLSETDFYRMRSNGYRTGSAEIRRGLTMINFKDIEDYPTNWMMSSNTSSTGTNVNYDITRASSTTASVSGDSAGVATMVYELKDGISY